MENYQACKVCNSATKFLFKNKILFYKYEISYYQCESCQFVQTEKPYWLGESYHNAFTYIDLPLVRCIKETKKTALICQIFERENSKLLDYAGGYGVFSRLMRDIGFDFLWQDIYAQNIFSNHFEYKEGDDISLITSFESFEHYANPIEEIEKILTISKNILFSTTLMPDMIPNKNWFYWGFEHGQHVAFYHKKSLKYIAKQYNLNFYSFKNLHLFTTKSLPPFVYSSLVLLSYLGGYKLLSYFKKSKISQDQEYLKNLYTQSGKVV